jgi:hypothetical protein
MNYAAIPLELQQLPQWVVWRYEVVESGRTTKVPYSPIHGRLASVSDPAGWAPFTLANNALASGLFSGIGFMLSPNDPYTFIDLDDPHALDERGLPKFSEEKKVEVMALQAEVYRRFSHSYSEVSPSGKGLHLIVRGVVPTGKRRNGVELYSAERYMTMTGNVHRAFPIVDCQADVEWLWNALGGGVNETPIYQGEQVDTEDDNTILGRAYRAVNGDKFAALWEGRYEEVGYPSQSEADFALIDMLVFYTNSVPQVKRLFNASALGARNKQTTIRGVPYVDHMISRAFDRALPPVDITNATAQMQAILASANAPVEQYSKSAIPAAVGANPYGRPIPGLLGQIAYFVYAASPRPVTEIALAAAIGLMAGICGRAYNVSGTGLNQYIMLLAGTGRGKESIHTGIRRLMTQVSAIGVGGGGCPAATEFLGPDDIASGQALIKYLTKTSRSFITVQGEFDLTLKSFTQKHANAALLKLKQVLLKSYSRSGRGQVLEGTIYAESDKNTAPIFSPAFSLIGEGTPERFYNLLDEGMVGDGLIPRFTIIHYDGERVKRHKLHRQADPPDGLVRALASLCGQALMLNQSNNVIDVGYEPAAEAFLDHYDEEVDRHINNAANGTIAEIWNRAHLKALKLAATVAVGVNPTQPIISLEHAQYAVDIVNYDTRRLVAKFETGDIGDSETRQVNDVRRVIRKLLERAPTPAEQAMAGSGIVSKRSLQMKTANMASFRNYQWGATRALERVIQTLLDGGMIQQLGPMDTRALAPQGAKLYKVLDMGWLQRGAHETAD